MEKSNDLLKMLELFPGPAFVVRDGQVFLCNQKATVRSILPGIDIGELLITGDGELQELKDGCLNLTLMTDGGPAGASVTTLDGGLLFRIDEQVSPDELNAMNLLCTDLRYPVQNLALRTQRLASQAGDPESAATIEHELSKIHRILNNVSNAYRFSHDRTPYQEERDICSVLEELLSECAALLAQAGITLRYTLPHESIPCLLDWHLIRQAIYNLLDNAAKASERNSIIEVSLSRKGRQLKLSVSDYGCGTPYGDYSKLFNHFCRSSESEGPQLGTGVGMYLVRNAARNHGGTVLVERMEPQGTRVTMTISIRQSTSATLRSPSVLVTGSADDGRIMLSNVLPASVYRK